MEGILKASLFGAFFLNLFAQNWISTFLTQWQHDEYYHISHSILFSKGVWEYDKYITTPPGLYLLGALYLNIVDLVNSVTLKLTFD